MAVSLLNNNAALFAASGSLSGSQTVNAGGTNVVAFVCVGWDNISGLSVSAITYGGNTMTACGSAAQQNGTPSVGTDTLYAQWFYLINPPTSSNTLAITVSGGTVNEIYATLVAYQGVHQTTPVRASSYQTNVGSAVGTLAITIPSNSNDVTVSTITEGRNAGQTTNQTQNTADTNGTMSRTDDHCTTPASSVTHTWTTNVNDGMALAGFSIQAASSGTTYTQSLFAAD